MSDFAEQLRSVRLKRTENPKPESTLLTTQANAFLTDKDIKSYQETVLDCNAENWYEIIRDCTFETRFCPINKEDAKFFIDIYAKYFQDKDLQEIESTDWRAQLDDTQKDTVIALETRLHTAMNEFIQNDGFAFVKTSSRSAKDSPLASKRFKKLYDDYLNVCKTSTNTKPSENEQITCLLKAAFDCLRVKTAQDVIEMFIKSERIYQDMKLALDHPERFNENFVIRKFYDIDIDMEFRGFVFDCKLNALSQYNYLIYSKRLDETKDDVQKKILDYYYTQVLPKIKVNDQFLKNFVIDFAVLPNGQVIVIELNPFLQTTDGALFSWVNERSILENGDKENGNFVFRYTTREQTGAKTMLPFSIRQVMELK